MKQFIINISFIMNESDLPVLIKQGAESKIYRLTYLGKPAVMKERFCKKYRHEDLDKRLTKERIKAEARSILRCKNAGICTPTVYLVDFEKRRIIMEWIGNSITVSEFINKLQQNPNDDKKTLMQLSSEMGSVIGKMHFNSIIHGDLTTSNILLQLENDKKWKLFLIDFGLSYAKSSDEDKAVDLYVLERALTSKHSDIEWFFNNFLKDYEKFNKMNERVIKKFQEVRSRGRKRNMIG